MKVCITGGAGMIGSNLLRNLVKKNYEVIVIDNFWRGKKENIDSIENWSFKNNFFEIDLSNPLNEINIQKVIKNCDVYKFMYVAQC